MGFVKVIAPGAQEFGEPQASMIKIARSGLKGADLCALVKRAGHKVADAMRHVKLGTGDVPIHLIALGAGEYFGMNRNGDLFSSSTCQKYHHTFVKHARWFHDHANKDVSKSWGIVPHSLYNDDMHRIELIVALNGTKEAAQRNGGFVADDELEKLARGADLAVSMACRVPFDVCSGCGNKARSRDEYCTGIDQGGHCKMGGLKDRITLVDDHGRQLYADNPDPTFFDISRVFRPADRIAWVTGQLKAASASIISGAQLAEQMGVTAPAYLLDEFSDPRHERLVKLAFTLAAIEKRIARDGVDHRSLAWAPSVQPNTSWDDSFCKTADVLVSLQVARVCPPLIGFMELGGIARGPNSTAVAKQASVYLPGIYGRMTNDATSIADFGRYAGQEGVPSLRARAWAEKRAADYGIGADDLRRRSVRASLQGDSVPSVRPTVLMKMAGAAYDWATSYALFKLALLDGLPRDGNFAGACEAVVRQNYV